MEGARQRRVRNPYIYSCGGGESAAEDQFIWPVKFGNTLPDVPFEAKFLPIPRDLNRYVKYKITDLERSFKYDIITDKDPPVMIDLVTLNSAPKDQKADDGINDIDMQLLDDDCGTQMDRRRSVQHGRLIPWLRKTEYMCSTASKLKRWSESRGKKFNQKLHDIVNEVNQYRSRESQLAAIEKKFSETKSIPRKHPYKAGVFAVEEMPILPDFEAALLDWRLAYTEVIFDSDQPMKRESGDRSADIHKYALIRGMMDENNEQFVAYLLPTDKALQRLKAGATRAEVGENKDKRFEYEFARQYNWHLRSKACANYEPNYCLTIRNGCAYYNEMDTSVRLSRCALNKRNNNLLDFRVMVTFRQPNDQEITAQEARLRTLQLLPDEDGEVGEHEDSSASEEDSPAKDNNAAFALENEAVDHEGLSYTLRKDVEEGESVGYSRNTSDGVEEEDSLNPSCSGK